MVNAAGNQIVARALRCRAREHRRFDFKKAQFVHRLAHLQNYAVAQLEIRMRTRTAQVTITQARLFARVHLLFDFEMEAFSHCSGCAAVKRLLPPLRSESRNSFSASAPRALPPPRQILRATPPPSCALRDAALY